MAALDRAGLARHRPITARLAATCSRFCWRGLTRLADGPATVDTRLLRHRPFVLYFIGRGFSRFAAQMATVALGWQVYAMTGSAFHLGLIGLAQFLPVRCWSSSPAMPPTATTGSGWCRSARLAQALAAAFLCWGSFEGWLTVPAIYAAVALLGVATAFELPATAALLTGVAPKGQFQRAAALNTGRLPGGGDLAARRSAASPMPRGRRCLMRSWRSSG